MISHKQRLEEIERYLSNRKVEYASDIRRFIACSELDEVEAIQLQMAECNILLIEQLGTEFFNWE
jgi:hypothetical protein